MVWGYEMDVLRGTEIVVYLLFIPNTSLYVPGAMPGPGVTLLSQPDTVPHGAHSSLTKQLLQSLGKCGSLQWPLRKTQAPPKESYPAQIQSRQRGERIRQVVASNSV